jgi:phage shock protein PspC (stress-responsive transcriptional regulator)
MNDIRQSFAQHGLVRSRDHRVLGGVLAGLGRRFGLGPWTTRLLFVLLLFVVPGSQLLVYPILWILMPSEDAVGMPVQHTGATPAT